MTLYDTLPDCLPVDGISYPIDTDFRPWARLWCTISGTSDKQKKADALADFIESAGLPLSWESVEAVLSFFVCGEDHVPGGEQKAGASAHVFDFQQDSSYIYAAFLDAYGIDLSRDKLHWYSFIALFKSLPESAQICKIMHYRAAKMSDVPKGQKKHYAEMKKRYALRREEAKTAADREAEWKKKVDDLYKKAEMQVSALRRGEQPGHD